MIYLNKKEENMNENEVRDILKQIEGLQQYIERKTKEKSLDSCIVRKLERLTKILKQCQV
jgi:hypothetical protein